MISSPHTILITGASSGLGKALALYYAQPDTTLLLTGRHEERLNQTAKDCQEKGAKTETLPCDITNKNTLITWISDHDKKTPIDLVIANAGISGGTSNHGESLEQIEVIFNTNIYGVIHTIEPLIATMRKRQHGQIAIIGSLAGYRGMPGAPAYSASKAAVRVYGEALRGTLCKDHIGVTVVTPGFIQTPLTDVNQFPMPFIMSSTRAATIIARRLRRNPPRIAFPFIMYSLILLLTFLPLRLTDMLFSRLPQKG